MKSAQEYKDSIREMKPLVYAFGGKVENVVDPKNRKPRRREESALSTCILSSLD